MSELIHEDVGRAALSSVLGFDLGDVGWNDRLPAERFAADTNKTKTYFHALRRMAVDEGRTLRQLSQQFAQARIGNVVAGSASRIADELERWVDQDGCDGFMIRALAFPDNLRDFCSAVVPELQERGRFRTAYEGTTLRSHLGLTKPAHPSAHAGAGEATRTAPTHAA